MISLIGYLTSLLQPNFSDENWMAMKKMKIQAIQATLIHWEDNQGVHESLRYEL